MRNDCPPLTNDNEQIEIKEKMIKDFSVDGYRIITKLTEKLERKKMTFVDQEELHILENERNLELQKSLASESEKMEALTKELSLAKAAIEAKDVELANTKASSVDEKNVNDVLKASVSCLEIDNKDLKAQVDSL